MRKGMERLAKKQWEKGGQMARKGEGKEWKKGDGQRDGKGN